MNTKSRIWICHLIVIGLVLNLTNSCKKQIDQGQPPVLETVIVYSITPTTAHSGGNITSDGGATITARGVCWSTVQNPTITDTKTTDGTGSGTFKSAITGLTATTNYYVKAYATNNAGTSYGNELLFKTFKGTVLDVDGNVYNTVTIGTQTWMAENLKTTKYLNGDLIGTTTLATLDISGESSPKYQWAYDGNESNVATYGRLYTWYAATDTRNVCPTGWHVPYDPDWHALATFLGGATSGAGEKLKETGLVHWQTPNAGATNETGFGALPSGYRDMVGTFNEIHNYSPWWSVTDFSLTDAQFWGTGYLNGNVFSGTSPKGYGYSVRCLKD